MFETIFTPEVIATFATLILGATGATAYLIKYRTKLDLVKRLVNTSIDSIQDGKLDANEIRSLLTILREFKV